MKDKHAAPGHTSIGALAAEGMLALPRQTKRLIMLAAPPVPIAMAFCATVVPKWSLMTAGAARVVGYRNSLRGSINGIRSQSCRQRGSSLKRSVFFETSELALYLEVTCLR